MNQDKKVDYYKINRKLRARRWKKHLNILWTLLIIPLGLVCLLVAGHSGSSLEKHPVAMASAGFPVLTKPPGVAPARPILPTRQLATKPVAKHAKAKPRHSARKHASAKHPASAKSMPPSSIAVGAGPGLVKE